MSIWNDLKLLWNHHISNWKVSHINFFLSWNMEEKLPEDGFWHEISSVPSHSSSAESSWASLLQRPQGRGSAHGLHISAYISSSAEPYFNHLSPAEFLSYKHANLRHHKRSTIFQKNMYNIQFFPWPFSIQTTTKRKKAYCISHRDVQQLQQSDRGAQASTANAGTPICCTALLQFSENSSFPADEKWRSS